jgi:hypothetical protein
MFTEFMTGKKNSVPSGTKLVRVAVLPLNPLKTPAKNHKVPRCPTAAFTPVVSSSGFTDVGIENAHCHHSAVSFLKSRILQMPRLLAA